MVVCVKTQVLYRTDTKLCSLNHRTTKPTAGRTWILKLPENNNNGTLAARDDHQPLPDHQRRGNDHTEVQHLVIELQETNWIRRDQQNQNHVVDPKGLYDDIRGRRTVKCLINVRLTKYSHINMKHLNSTAPKTHFTIRWNSFYKTQLNLRNIV